jgi:hypothetical protein
MRCGDIKNSERADSALALTLAVSVSLEVKVLPVVPKPLGRVEQRAADYLRGFCLGKDLSSRW